MDVEALAVPNPALVVNDLTFRYRDRAEPSIAGISFEMRRGELLLLLASIGLSLFGFGKFWVPPGLVQ